MFRHLLKPLWKRKSRNLMLTLELLLAFIVVFVCAAASGRYYQLYHLPTGFQYAAVWSIQLEHPGEAGSTMDAALYDNFKRSLEALPEVEKVAFSSFSPYQRSTWQTGLYLPDTGIRMDSDMMQVDDDTFAVLGMSLLQGRWFSRMDEGSAQKPVVINRRLAEAMFGSADPIGKVISEGELGDKDSALLKVTGVFEDFRNHGEFMVPTNFMLTRFSPTSGKDSADTLLLKVRPGTERIFEAKLSERLKQIRNDISYRISPLSDLRQTMLNEAMIPLLVLSVVAAFLLLMVAFGLFGVLWQNTARRIPEIGTRRAAGATAVDIYRQIITEQLLLSSLAMTVGLILLVQLPLTGVFGDNLNWPLFLIATLASVAIMALVSILCALYPAWRASRLTPTEALHYE